MVECHYGDQRIPADFRNYFGAEWMRGVSAGDQRVYEFEKKLCVAVTVKTSANVLRKALIRPGVGLSDDNLLPVGINQIDNNFLFFFLILLASGSELRV